MQSCSFFALSLPLFLFPLLWGVLCAGICTGWFLGVGSGFGGGGVLFPSGLVQCYSSLLQAYSIMGLFMSNSDDLVWLLCMQMQCLVCVRATCVQGESS